MAEFVYNGKNVSITAPALEGNIVSKLESGRFYEQKFLEYIASLNKKGLYLDVGGNIGNHTVFFANFTKATEVMSFEPHPEVFKSLKKNVKANDPKKKVKLKHMALGEEEGSVQIEEAESDKLGGSRVKKGGDIPMKRLDDVVGKNKVSVIKVDVEGFEEAVLRGATAVLKRDKPELFLEAGTAADKEKIEAVISEFGYVPVKAYNNTATYHYSTKIKPNKLEYMLTTPYLVRRLLRNS